MPKILILAIFMVLNYLPSHANNSHSKVGTQNLQIKKLEKALSWINPKAISLYLEDMKKNENFDFSKYKALYDELISNLDEVKKEILLVNPILDADKIAVARFKLGTNARKASAPDIGSASNNWSSMFNVKQHGFDAELSELSDLRGDKINIRTIYNPSASVNIADLQMHWDAESFLFTSVNEKDRWSIYEVGLDGLGIKQEVVLEDEDIEFCDANYLPDGRTILSSNVGYHGVPCVHGDSEVVNM